MKRTLLITCSALAGLLAGFGLRAWRQTTTPAEEVARHAAVKAPAVISGAPDKPDPQKGSALVQALQANLSMTDGVTRWLHWMTAVEKAGPEDFPHLVRQAGSMPGALKMIAARWIERDPLGMFEACQNNAASLGTEAQVNELAHLLFETWPQDDPEAVLAFLKSQPSMTSGWQFTALNTLFKARPEQALITMSALGIDSYSPNMGGVQKWAASDPRHAAEVALSHPAGYATERILETIAREWAKMDPAAALSFAAAQDRGMASGLANQVLRDWVARDLGKASDWFARADETSRKNLLPAFVEAWGKQDTAAALQWCQDNTEGRQQTVVMQSLVQGKLEQDPDAAASLILGLEPSSQRTNVAAAFAEEMLHRGWFPGNIALGPQTAKPEAIAWLQQLDPAARKEVIRNIAWGWGGNDPKGFVEFLRSSDGLDASPPEAISHAVRGLVRDNPQEALAWAGQVPEALREHTLATTFQGWTQAQPEAAMTWLRQLPADDPRREGCYLGVVEHVVPSFAFHDGPISSLEPIEQGQRRLAHLLATNPAAIPRAIGELSLPTEERTRILKQLLPGKPDSAR